MRLAIRLLVPVIMVIVLVTTFVPARAATGLIKASCCASMKANTFAGDSGCRHDQPTQSNDERCCAGCAFCVAVLPARTNRFACPPAAEQGFTMLLVNALSRSERPPVPPPRAPLL